MSTWEHGHPDPRCALCGSTPGRVRVRAGAAVRSVRRVVVVVRLVPSTVALAVETSDEERPGDRLATCPSCIETDAALARELEGAVIVVPPRAAERSERR